MPRKGEPTERSCIVTREAMPVSALIRFVVAPDGEVVPDLRRRLPGRGVWVTATAEKVRIAERKHLFAKALGVPVKVTPGLAERVADLLREAALAALSLARKAGTAVSGFAKVETAVARGEVAALIHAAEASADGAAKLDGAARRRAGDGREIPVIRSYTGEQLDLAFGRPNVVHAALLAGPASDNVLVRIASLADFLGGDEGAGSLLTEPNEVSAEP